jgi:hypothetical protein
VDEFTKSVFSIHYYDSILVIEKRPIEKPYHENTGTPSFVQLSTPENSLSKIRNKITRSILKVTNKVLRYFRLSGFVWK